MARRRKARAKRRVAERTRRNALALEEAALADEERLVKLKRARHVEQLAFLEARGAISDRQRAAGERLRRDFAIAGDMPRLVAWYEPRAARPPRQFLYNNNDSDPTRLDARRRFEQAIRPLGSRIVPIVLHTAVLDLPLSEWRAPLGTRNGDAAALLRLGLSVLADGYHLAPECDAAEGPRTGEGHADGVPGCPSRLRRALRAARRPSPSRLPDALHPHTGLG
jgi:Domain of unknown function (DUF6456)